MPHRQEIGCAQDRGCRRKRGLRKHGRKSDIGTIINKKMIAASYIYQMMLDADVMNVRFLMSANADVAEFIAKEDSKVTQNR